MSKTHVVVYCLSDPHSRCVYGIISYIHVRTCTVLSLCVCVCVCVCVHVHVVYMYVCCVCVCVLERVMLHVMQATCHVQDYNFIDIMLRLNVVKPRWQSDETSHSSIHIMYMCSIYMYMYIYTYMYMYTACSTCCCSKTAIGQHPQ